MREYLFLDPGQAIQIRRQRLLDLESQHYGALIMLEEEPGNQKLLATIDDLANRIRHHITVLTEGDQAEQDDGAASPDGVLPGPPS